ncbi:MAG: lipid-A-disaccharide synthase [bacterium]
MGAPLIFLSAGDPSGDNAAARMLGELRRLRPDLQCYGLGGTRLQEQGQTQLVDSARLAVLGFWEVARHFFFFRGLMKQCVRDISQRRPDVIVLVDYPGFNLRLAERVRKLKIPIVYYISPQVWAWGKGRLPQMKRLIDLMLYILPFEKGVFEAAGIPSRFVGHYLMEDIPQQYLATNPPADGHLAVLPGSRPQEIQRHLRPMLTAARMFCRRNNAQATIAAVSGTFDYDSVLSAEDRQFITITYDNPRRVIYDAAQVLTASGTATLETALIGRPMVVVYKTGWITYQIARRLIDLKYIALANLIHGRSLVPELIQNQVTGGEIDRQLQALADDNKARQQMITTLHQTPQLLGSVGASGNAAAAVAEYLPGGGATRC